MGQAHYRVQPGRNLCGRLGGRAGAYRRIGETPRVSCDRCRERMSEILRDLRRIGSRGPDRGWIPESVAS